MLDPTLGQILVDDKNINQFKSSWQNIISYVPQNIHLLDASIGENVVFSKNIQNLNQNKIITACINSGLEKFIASLPNGIDTRIGELGSKLSGGQIQRIGIARALYKDPEILIFDEATNALDENTEMKILQSIEKIKKIKTIIIITHKKENLFFCDDKYLIVNQKIKPI